MLLFILMVCRVCISRMIKKHFSAHRLYLSSVCIPMHSTNIYQACSSGKNHAGMRAWDALLYMQLMPCLALDKWQAVIIMGSRRWYMKTRQLSFRGCKEQAWRFEAAEFRVTRTTVEQGRWKAVCDREGGGGGQDSRFLSLAEKCHSGGLTLRAGRSEAATQRHSERKPCNSKEHTCSGYFLIQLNTL